MADDRLLQRGCRPYPGPVSHNRPRSAALRDSASAKAPRRLRTGLFAGGLAVVGLALVLTVSRPQPATGPCPERPATTLAAAGHTLRMRFEPTGDRIGLFNLCLNTSAAVVRNWSLTLRTSERTVVVPVLALGERRAIADAAIDPPQVTVDIAARLASGATAHFETVI